jgi:hypothetical protein
MAKGRAQRTGGSYRDGDGDADRDPDRDDDHRPERDGSYEHEPFDDPNEHRLIERRRFHGGLPPTPERYAQAREQWYALPGAVVRPSMDPPIATGPPSPGELEGERSPR